LSKIDFGDESLNKLILSLKKRLPYYLIEKGIYGEDPADKMDHLGLTDDTMSLDVAFHCISPDHKDNNPSMVFVPKDKTGDGEYSLVRCWSCGRKADIFQAASWLEDLPSSGPDWVQKNVYKLAERFKLEFERIQPTDEQLKMRPMFCRVSFRPARSATHSSTPKLEAYMTLCVLNGESGQSTGTSSSAR
jgi:hypothetical protein